MKPSLQTRSESFGLGVDGGRGEITHYKYLLLRNYGIKDHVKGTSLSKHFIQLTCPGTFSLVGRVSAPGNRSS